MYIPKKRYWFVILTVSVLLISIILSNFTFARYETYQSAVMTAPLAKFEPGIVGVTDQQSDNTHLNEATITIALDEVYPGMPAKDYYFDVRNFNGSEYSNLPFHYELEIKTYGNLPITLSLTGFDSNIANALPDYCESKELVYAGVNQPVEIRTTGGIMEINTASNTQNYYHRYKLTVNWDKSHGDNPILATEVDCIKISTVCLQAGENYKLTFDYNGGNFVVTDKTIYYNYSYGSLPNPDRTGYTFQYWEVNGVPINSSTQINTSGNRDAVAVWSANQYTITFNGNGANSNVSTSSIKSTFDGTYNLATATRTGYLFDGWYTAASGGTKVTENTKLTKAYNHTLYAHWTPITYSIKYNGNGNTSGSMSNSSHTYDVSKNLTTNVFTRTGYIFLGWSTSSTASSATYTNGQSVKNISTSNGAVVNLYAVWSPITYAIKYNGRGNTGGSMSNSSHTYDVPKNLTTNAFTRTGYTFQGWATSSDSQTVAFSNGSSVTNLSATNGDTINLYAVWKVNTYAITLNANGGSLNGGEGTLYFRFGISSGGYYFTDQACTKPILSSGTTLTKKPTRSGYTLKGFTLNQNGTGTQYINQEALFINNCYKNEARNFTLYAQWGADFNLPSSFSHGIFVTRSGNNPPSSTLPIGCSDSATQYVYEIKSSSTMDLSNYTYMSFDIYVSATGDTLTKFNKANGQIELNSSGAANDNAEFAHTWQTLRTFVSGGTFKTGWNTVVASFPGPTGSVNKSAINFMRIYWAGGSTETAATTGAIANFKFHYSKPS